MFPSALSLKNLFVSASKSTPNCFSNAKIPTTAILPPRPNIKNPRIPSSLIPAGKDCTMLIKPLTPLKTIWNTGLNKSINAAVPNIACLIKLTIPWPTAVAKSDNAFELASILLLITTSAFLTKSKNPASFVSSLNLNNLSDNIDNVPVNVVAKTSVALENLPFSPNNNSNLSIVSSVVTAIPALNPSNALTPLSLKRSAAPIPDENDLCICSAVVLKSNPVTAATLPVIFKTFCSSSALSVTTAKLPDADAISCSEKGTLPAKSIKPLNAFCPSATLPNKKLNLIPSSSTSLPTFTNDLTTSPPPIPINADCTENIDALKLESPARIPLKACLVLSLANIFNTKFCAIIYALLYS